MDFQYPARLETGEASNLNLSIQWFLFEIPKVGAQIRVRFKYEYVPSIQSPAGVDLQKKNCKRMHRFHSVSIRILFSKHGSPFASFTLCWATNTPWTSTQGSRGSSAPSVRHDPNVASEALGGWGGLFPRGPASNPTRLGVSRFSVWPFAEQIGWKRLLLIVFSSGHFSWLFSPLFFQSPGKKHLRLRLDKDKSHPCKAQKLLLHARARNEERLGEFIDDAGQNLMVVFFRFVFFKTSTPCQLLKLSRLVGVEMKESEVAMEKQRIWHVMTFCLPQCFVESRCFESNWFCSFFKLIYFLKTNMSYHKCCFFSKHPMFQLLDIH